VRDEVRRRIDDFGPDGGFVASAVHNIQANVPPQNIMAMWETLQEYGVYGPGGVGQRPADYVPAPRIDAPSRQSSPDAMAGRMPTPEEVAAAEAAIAADLAATPILLLDMRDAIIEGDVEDAVAACREGLDEGISPQAVISEGVVPAMTEVGMRFETAKYFLPEMMASAIAARGVLEVLRPRLAAANAEPVARVVLGTVKGDLHDIGKNLVSMMMEGAGFEVVDLGTDVSAEQFISAIQTHKPQLVGLSALLTTTAPMMRHIVKSFDNAGVRGGLKVLVGGAAVSPEYASEIGADGYAPDAGASVRKAKELLALA
jgi:5-methyltetrahydrofolate--homocysteine methyltransferase